MCKQSHAVLGQIEHKEKENSVQGGGKVSGQKLINFKASLLKVKVFHCKMHLFTSNLMDMERHLQMVGFRNLGREEDRNEH